MTFELRTAVRGISGSSSGRGPYSLPPMASKTWQLPSNTPRPMVWLGLLGLVLAALCVAVAGVRGLMIPPEGDLTKAITFDVAIGLFWLTLAFIVPLARFSARGIRAWLCAVVPLSLYAYGVETVQILR